MKSKIKIVYIIEYIIDVIHYVKGNPPAPGSYLFFRFPMGKFDWGVWYVIIFLYVQFLIWLAVVSKRGKKVRTVAFPAVRSVNKSRDTRNCV